jgi:peptidoglycan/LPS O-acetylase OafA/YrhL
LELRKKIRDDIISSNKQIIHELDILRTIAITCVIVAHMDIIYYYSLYNKIALGTTGNLIFFFISGFLLKDVTIHTFRGAIDFIHNKFLRLSGLYYIALAFAIYFSIVFQTGAWEPTPSLNIENVVLHIFYLQAFTENYRIGPFWFVSALLSYFIIFALCGSVSKNKFYSIIYLFIIWVIIKTLSPIPFFNMLGFYGYDTFVIGYVTGIAFNYFHPPVILNCPSIFKVVSYSSYAMYLFHIPIILVVKYELDRLNIPNGLSFLIVGLVLTVGCAYFIQRVYDLSHQMLIDAGILKKKRLTQQ